MSEKIVEIEEDTLLWIDERYNRLRAENKRLHSIIKEAREEVRIYEVQSKDGITNELDNYVFVQRLKNVLNKGE